MADGALKMSIFALEVIAEHSDDTPIGNILDKIVSCAYAHRCSSDDLSDTIAVGFLWGKEWPDVLEEVIGYFDQGMNRDAIMHFFKEQWLEKESRLTARGKH